MFRLTSFLAAAALLFVACSDTAPTKPTGVTVASVVSTFPASAATNAPRNALISVTFGAARSPAEISATRFTLRSGATDVAGAVTYTATTATFVPSAPLAANTMYTASISRNIFRSGSAVFTGSGSESATTWSFTTDASLHVGPAPVNLGTSGDFAILAKSGISTTGTTAIVGDIGVSPIAASGITGFGLSAPPTTFATSALVTGQVFASNYNPPTPAMLTTAVLDMEAAYTDAAGRTNPTATELGAGNIDGMTLVSGVYKFSTGLLIPNTLTLNGGAHDVWIFQIAQDLTVGNGAIITLTGGAKPENVFWQVGGKATIGTTADFSGIILSKTLISFNTGAEFNGRALAQTAVTLNGTTVTEPGATPPPAPTPTDTTTPPDTTVTPPVPTPFVPQLPIDLGDIGHKVIFAKHGILMNCPSTIYGEVGSVPPAEAYAQDFRDAVADAIGRMNPNYTNLDNGWLDGNTLTPGLYKWDGSVSITGDITLSGDADDVFIFQIGSQLHVYEGVTVHLAGGVLAENVFWQVTDDVTLNANSTFQGIILSGSIIHINEGATLYGRAFADSEVRLCGAVVTGPGTTLPPVTPPDSTPPIPTDTTTPPIPTDTTTTPSPNTGPTFVDLKTAAGFCILAKTGVSTTGLTSIRGDVGLSPAAGSYLTGFSLSAPATTFTTSPYVIGRLYAADYNPPTPAMLTLAVLDMEAAYNDAAGRPSPNYTNLGAGALIHGQTVVPGLYKWTTGLSVSGDVTLAGGPNDVWIFQIAQGLTVASGAKILLTGGAQAKNVFWQVASGATLGTTSQFAGYILSKTLIAFQTNSRINGCALAQTAVTLDATTVVSP